MATAYSGLPSAQVAIARALVASPRWTWAAHTVALRPDGALVEFLPGRAPSRERSVQDGLVPLLTDPAVVGHLMALLEAACGAEVAYAQGRRQGPEGQPVFWCTLEASAHRKSWTGSCLGEALAQALVARWRALDRGRLPSPQGRDRGEPPSGWAQHVMDRVARGQAGGAS